MAVSPTGCDVVGWSCTLLESQVQVRPWHLSPVASGRACIRHPVAVALGPFSLCSSSSSTAFFRTVHILDKLDKLRSDNDTLNQLFFMKFSLGGGLD